MSSAEYIVLYTGYSSNLERFGHGGNGTRIYPRKPDPITAPQSLHRAVRRTMFFTIAATLLQAL